MIMSGGGRGDCVLPVKSSHPGGSFGVQSRLGRVLLVGLPVPVRFLFVRPPVPSVLVLPVSV